MARGQPHSVPLFMVAALTCVGSLVIPGTMAAFFEINNIAEAFSSMGPRQNAMPTMLGEAFAYNNDLRVGTSEGATIGFTNGNCLVSAEVTAGIPNTYYECYETLVFTGGDYQGSSLTVVGFYDFVANGPLAIVGGTGQFRGATGELNYIYPADPNAAYSLPDLVFVTPNFGATPPATPAPTANLPSPGPPATTCDPGSSKANQCFNGNGTTFVCCAGGCGPSGDTATCA